jgi:hypothetical protein
VSILGLHLDDAAFAVARDGAPLGVVAPSIVHADPADAACFGAPAADAARRTPHRVSHGHWAAFGVADDDGPGASRTTAARAALTVAAAELRRRVAPQLSPGDRLHIAVPASLDAAALGWVLAACRQAALPVAGFHDAAALAVAALGLEGEVIVPAIGLTHLSATRVVVADGEARRRAVRVSREAGLLAMQQRWLEMVAEAMVLRSRFDPLHDAASEQRLYDLLPAAAARAAREGSATIELPVGATSCAVTLSRDQFAAAVRPQTRALAASVDALRSDGAPPTLLLSTALLDLPGVVEALSAAPGVRLHAMDVDLVARAASSLPVPAGVAADGAAQGPAAEEVPLRRGVAVGATLGEARPVEAAAEAVRAAPTHVLWRGAAIALVPGGALEVGRAPAADGIRLDEGLAGVSRLHCTLRHGPDGVQVIDHAAHGTWLNGRRVAGRARLAAGDRLRIGDPGVELALIAVGPEAAVDAGAG